MIGVISLLPLAARISVENCRRTEARRGGNPFGEKESGQAVRRRRQWKTTVENFACEPPCRGLTGGAVSVKNRGMSAQMFS